MNILHQDLQQSGELRRKAEQALKRLKKCDLCPRNCLVNRLDGEQGFCNTGKDARIASYGPHFGEEQPLVGSNGSGTIFFASCSLRCCFCQNYEISHHPEKSQETTPEVLAAVMLELQDQGCHNINMVTPSHVVPQLLEALVIAVEKGLSLPLIYNCGGYENISTLELLNGVIDIYMPDFKFWSPEAGKKYIDEPNYPEIARKTLAVMHEQVGDLKISKEGLATKGLLVRHLIMPGFLDDTANILKFISCSLSHETYINIMDQYRPSGKTTRHPEIMRSIKPEEYNRAMELAKQEGLKRVDKRDISTLLRNLGFI